VEGQAGGCLGKDSPENGVEVVEDFVGGNPHRFYGRLCKPVIPGLVARGPVSPAVRFAVDLDRQSSIAAVEIEAVGAGRVLAAKLEVAGSRTQVPPRAGPRAGSFCAAGGGTG
jgi:hypothetical protein